jgi:predicted aspartyl protease
MEFPQSRRNTMLTTLITTLALAGTVQAQTISTHYEAGHFYATPQTAAGQPLRLLVDTGGAGVAGMYWLSAAAAQRLGLKTDTCSLDGTPLSVAVPPVYKHGQDLPASIGPCTGKLMVNPVPYTDDGQLGAAYLGTRVWTFDYPLQQLIAEAGDWRPDPTAHHTPLGFQMNEQGNVVQHFPRIVVRIDGQPLNMLLDTGATAHPTAQGEAAAGTATVKGIGVTSYITTGVLERWHKAHPEWKVVDKGDDMLAPRFIARLIRVPTVEIAGWSVGPVWFTERRDAAFHGMMAAIMDESPEGAIGGNVFDHFTMTIDYPHATAWFRCAHDCVTTAL